MEQTDPITERKAVTMLARGDTQQKVANKLSIPQSTVSAIKKRNSELLANIEERVENYRAEKAAELLTKSQKLLTKKLDKLDTNDGALSQTKLSELVTVMKEAHQQIRLETGKPTSISSTANVPPEQATTENLEDLVKAIKEGDEIELQRLVFRAK